MSSCFNGADYARMGSGSGVPAAGPRRTLQEIFDGTGAVPNPTSNEGQAAWKILEAPFPDSNDG